MQQHDIPELTPDEELDRTRVLPDPVDPLEGSARLPELRPEDEPGPEDEPEVPQKPKRRGRVVRKIVKYFLFLVLAVAIVAAGGIGYLTVTEYRPAYAEVAQRGNVLRESKLTGGQTVRVLTLNTGYGGLDAGEDFFMDGGEGVRPSDAETVRQNMLGIEDLIRGADADFVMLQEVDTDSKRSYGYDQWRQYEFDLADYESRFALNYSCDYVPYPVTHRPRALRRCDLQPLRHHGRHALPPAVPVLVAGAHRQSQALSARHPHPHRRLGAGARAREPAPRGL